jgi:hypothetical protein
MSDGFTFADLTVSFAPLAERLDKEGMPVEGICKAFAEYARCKVNNSMNRGKISKYDIF